MFWLNCYQVIYIRVEYSLVQTAKQLANTDRPTKLHQQLYSPRLPTPSPQPLRLPILLTPYIQPPLDGVRTFGRQDVWATDVWATTFFSDDHLGDTAWTFGRQKLDVWATMTRRLGDKNESLNLGQPQPQESGLFTRSLTVIICLGTHMSF